MPARQARPPAVNAAGTQPLQAEHQKILPFSGVPWHPEANLARGQVQGI
jgi:hypothetical protein